MTAQFVLVLDASTPRCTLALGRLDSDRSTPLPDLVAGDDTLARGRQASAELSSRMTALLSRAGVSPEQLAAVACGVGPGMFTGVRVAIATAKGIALGLRIPAVGVSTLAAVAATERSAGAPAGRLALLDARRGEVYAGRYTVAEDVVALAPDSCAALETVLASLDSPTAAVGSGVEVYREQLEAHPRITHLADEPGPSAEGLWHATCSAWETRTDASALAAVYLRKSYAELGIHKPKRPFVKSPFVD